MDDERFLWLIMKSLNGEITPEEREELGEITKLSSVNDKKFQLLNKFWSQEVFYNTSADANTALEKVLGRINNEEGGEAMVEKLSLSRYAKLAIAALVILAIGIGLFVQAKLGKDDEQLVEKYNGKGSRSMITLSDGTRVWLNSDSKISFPKTFSGKTRKIYLTGEAFFQVAHNPEKPFLINLNKAWIKVVGTSFNVKAYLNDEDIQTSVLTGKVAFITTTDRTAKSTDTVFLVKNNKITLSKISGKLVKESVATYEDKEWIHGKLIFKSESLESISKKLERSFDKKILFKDQKLKKQKFTGTFDESSLDEILYYLSMSKPFKYIATDSTLTIY